ncbi:MAG: InlB B-repeat-containing protein [Spirochaetaceae bacterium]|nr:InlB B-repeat-containing protein [Spirochaetaceae bacterium]
MKDDNKPKLFIYILLTVVFVVLIASCGGGGGGGGGGMVAFAPDNNMPNNGGDAGGWGTGTDTGGGGIGGSTIQEDNATLLLGQSAALSYQKVDIDLVVNGEHFAINNVTATTTTEVLPNIPLGATVSGTATIYLANGTTRTALLEMTEIGIHNNLVFKVPYNYTCVDASSVAEITSGTYFSRDGIDLSSFTNHPIIGWKCQEDGSVHAGGYITGVRGDITLEPLFDTGVIYNITYVSPITSQSVPNDTYTSAASKTLPVLSESNLTFAGWYDNQSYNGQPVATIPLGTTGDKVYYAKWTAAVTYNGNASGVVLQNGQSIVVYNTSENQPSDPTRNYYDFGGWYTDSGCTSAYDFTNPVTQNITLYAKWNPIQYTVTYSVPSGIGVTVPQDTYTVLTGLNTLQTPAAVSGLTFVGWYTDSSLNESYRITQIQPGESGSRTLYGKWTATVTFDGKGGQVSYNQGTVIYNNTVRKPDDPTKTDYEFDGWYTDSSCTSAYNFDSSVTNSFTLYAKWNPVITYISPVTLSAEFQPGGAEASYDSTLGKTLSDPSYTGLNFAGWFEDADFQTGRKTSITQGSTAPITYYAKWTVAVAFNPNGGGGSTVTRNVVYGTKAQPITHPSAPSGSSATFDDWYTGTTSGGVLTLDSTAFDFDNTVITETTVLYARWVTTISFNANGGSGSFTPLNDVALGSKITFPSPGPTKNNCVFTGWYKDSGGIFKFSDPIDKGMTLYAGWQQVNQSGTRDTWFETNAGISITDNADGDTTYCLRLNNDSVSGIGTALAVTNNKSGTTTTAYLDIQGTNSFAGSNHGGLKLTTATSGSKTIKIVFCTSSSGTITLRGDRGCIQVENVTATFELMSGCKATEMKIGSTTYTDFNTFVNAMKNESFSRYKTATLKIERE